METKSRKYITFIPSPEVAELLKKHISSKNLNFSGWARSVVLKNLVSEGVLNESYEVIEPWGSVDSRQGERVYSPHKSKTASKMVGFCVTDNFAAFEALDNYTFGHPKYGSRSGAIEFWILQELVMAGSAGLNSKVGRRYKKAVAA